MGTRVHLLVLKDTGYEKTFSGWPHSSQNKIP